MNTLLTLLLGFALGAGLVSLRLASARQAGRDEGIDEFAKYLIECGESPFEVAYWTLGAKARRIVVRPDGGAR